MTVIEKLDMNVKQANSDFVAIKNKIVEKGVEVADGTRTAEYASKVDEVYEAGKKAQYDEFWDNYQDYGNRTNYQDAFAGKGWTEEIFKPKYDINIVGSALRMFSDNTGIRDLKAILDKYGVVINTSKATNLSYLLTSTNIETFGVLDTTSLTKLTDILYYCPKLKSVEKVILKGDGSQSFTSAFSELGSLEHIVFEGVIGQNGLNLQSSTKLSKASITSVINALSAHADRLTVTLSLAAVNKAFETSSGANDGSTSDEWVYLTQPKQGWTINLV